LPTVHTKLTLHKKANKQVLPKKGDSPRYESKQVVFFIQCHLRDIKQKAR